MPNTIRVAGFSVTELSPEIRCKMMILNIIKTTSKNPIAIPMEINQTGVSQLVTLIFWASKKVADDMLCSFNSGVALLRPGNRFAGN